MEVSCQHHIPVALTPWKEPLLTTGYEAGRLCPVLKKKILIPCQNLHPDHAIVQPVVSRYMA
jgi:hypothetical protein